LDVDFLDGKNLVGVFECVTEISLGNVELRHSWHKEPAFAAGSAIYHFTESLDINLIYFHSI
jgi:hypothetical protein